MPGQLDFWCRKQATANAGRSRSGHIHARGDCTLRCPEDILLKGKADQALLWTYHTWPVHLPQLTLKVKAVHVPLSNRLNDRSNGPLRGCCTQSIADATTTRQSKLNETTNLCRCVILDIGTLSPRSQASTENTVKHKYWYPWKRFKHILQRKVFKLLCYGNRWFLKSEKCHNCRSFE